MADTYRVFISSTYLDNKQRRKEVKEAIERAGMMPVGMERFTADERPTVNVCQNRAAECELFVGIVAHRYGWEPEGQPPGDEKSITWLEYEAARAKDRPCLMFEIDPAAKFGMEDLDPPPHTWRKRERLEQFKVIYRKDQMPAVFEDGKLGMAVMQALVEWQKRLHDKPPPVGRQPAPDIEDGLRRYREAAVAEHGTLLLSGFKTRLRVPIDLEELYVPLKATIDLRGQGEAGYADARDAAKRVEGRSHEAKLMEAFKLAGRVKRKGLVVLGEPGSGKTTHLKRLLLCCLREGQGPEKLGLPAGMVPVLLPLRKLEDPDREAVGQFIERNIDEQLGGPGELGKRLLARGNLLLLFDGLDEVADPGRRERVARWVEEGLKKHPSCRPVVTCRFAGYGEQGAGRGEVRLGDEFLELHIQPLSIEQSEKFIRNWYRLVETGLDLDPDRGAAERRAEERASALVGQLRKGDMRTARVAEMVGNPLLLANLCLVHRDNGRLPEDRKRLYDESVDVLLERWRQRPGALANVKVEQAKRALQPVAEWLHQEKGRTAASGAELAPVLEPALKAVRWEGGGAKEFLGTVRDESGLLTGWGPERYGFMHLGFQEYLAASELRRLAAEGDEKQRGAVLEKLAGCYGESWWQEVLLLFVAMGNPSMFGPLMREVVKRPAFAEQRELLGLLLEEAAERDVGPFAELLQQAAGGDEGLRARQRAAVDVLRQMGEQELLARLGVASEPAVGKVEVTEKGGVELVYIPGGEFLMGSPTDEEGRFENEGPQHRVKVSPFWLGRYPVTNEQYGRFLKENPGARLPKYWSDRRLNQPKQPVVEVSWEEAKAFAEWAGGRLPTEAEWEYACRAGTTGARYEDDLDAIAWYGANSSGTTHPVGEKKPNAWGLYDMLGNVYEWCDDWLGEYDARPAYDPRGPEAGSRRVIRGGSRVYGARSVRAASRYWSAPGHDWDHVGLRLARGQNAPSKPAGRSPGSAERPR